jgi:hypothetical protein
MNAGSESDLVTAILQYLHLRGVVAWRNNAAGVKRTDRKGREFYVFRGRRGVTDILGIMPDGTGRLLAIEAKTLTGKLSEEQRAFLDDVNRAGGVACVARSLDDVAAMLAAECKS